MGPSSLSTQKLMMPTSTSATDLDQARASQLSLWNPALLATLPFDPNKIKRYLTEGVLHRTRNRWTWFAEGERRNPSLGTLGFLPAEIRRMIIENLLYCRPNPSMDGVWEYDHLLGPIFDLQAYYFGFGRRGLYDMNNSIRLVSSSLRADYDEVFLSDRTFRFNRPDSLAAFLDRLNESQASRLLSIAIGLDITHRLPLWLGPRLRLPIALKEVKVHIFPMWSRYVLRPGLETSEALETIIRNIVVEAPNAQISVQSADQYPLSTECQVIVDKILGKIELEKDTTVNTFVIVENES